MLDTEQTQTGIDRLHIVDERGKTSLKKRHTPRRVQPSKYGVAKATKVQGYHGKEISSSTVGHFGLAKAQSKPNFGDRVNFNVKTDT